MSTNIPVVVKWGKATYNIEVNTAESVAVLKTQLENLTSVPHDKQKIMGLPGGLLKDSDDLSKKITKPNQKITLLGTAVAQQLKAPTASTVFVEDLSDEERRKVLKEREVETLPIGLVNLGNSCYMNATLQALYAVPPLRQALLKYYDSSAHSEGSNQERSLSALIHQTFKDLGTKADAVEPASLFMLLRVMYPETFGKTTQGGIPQQQDADEFLRALMLNLSDTVKTPHSNVIDDLFGFTMKTRMRCLEAEAEPESVSEERHRVLLCHMGTPTDPVGHLYQGVQLSLKETITKQASVLGRDAEFEKSSAMDSLPEYLIVEFARFQWKGESTSAGHFPQVLDVYDFCTEDVRKQLTRGRQRRRVYMDEQERKRIQAKEANRKDSDVEMDATEEDSSVAQIPTGNYRCVSIVSHEGRSAEGGHYMGWAKFKEADGDVFKEDQWVRFNDDKVTQHDWKYVVDQLVGGRADTQIAYIVIYQKDKVPDGSIEEIVDEEMEMESNPDKKKAKQ
ncbi:tRNA-guaninine transglycosylase, putative [Perkinsus marinus ATCC 50983]|uniref:ubiquitinyl hydrolase 1 n=1 Tax=Perkinsus marinus (strain ATCC 50983 / TXsc) TaxID=423536 RepID=C5LMS0_PERM5|nr:tRNA-guaninine transglycosylase, putative [Perkinsus marinus ATCC 50983]EER01961.1 tRNA-guaninine transglycosylase, putative [Perkinsus marinus ATCC 50983]|eukprot:XP_002769243.1 tRNA-guaninine transglycosylase, putative [Perkinsus marinus ATCC 50983]